MFKINMFLLRLSIYCAYDLNIIVKLNFIFISLKLYSVILVEFANGTYSHVRVNGSNADAQINRQNGP